SPTRKKYDHEFKINNLLIQLRDAYLNNEKNKSYYITIMDRFAKIIKELDVTLNLIDEIEEKLTSIMKSDLAYDDMLNCFKAVGEDSSAKILSAYLQSLDITARYVNPKEAGILVNNDANGAQLLPKSYGEIYKLRKEEGVLVIPGFFGYTEDGILATFSRGGSDITGSIVAAGVKAELYENFTDVDSVYSVNPAIIKNPKEIKILTYR